MSRPLPRVLFMIPMTLMGAVTGCAFTSGYCLERMSQLPTPLGRTVNEMYTSCVPF